MKKRKGLDCTYNSARAETLECYQCGLGTATENRNKLAARKSSQLDPYNLLQYLREKKYITIIFEQLFQVSKIWDTEKMTFEYGKDDVQIILVAKQDTVLLPENTDSVPVHCV